MKIGKEDMSWAVTQGLLSEDQSANLWEALSGRTKNRPRFDLANVGYYAGALIVIIAMTWFLVNSWDKWGHAGILMVSSVYGLIFYIAGARCWRKEDTRTPGGLLLTIAVCMVPLIVFGCLHLLGIDCGSGYQPLWSPDGWCSSEGNRVIMELWTAIATVVVIRKYPFPFLLAPLSASVWAMSNDLTWFIWGNNWVDRNTWISIGFGLTMMFTAYFIDLKRKTTQDFAFWLYLFGTMAYWGGLAFLNHKTEFGQFVFAMINIGLMLLSVLLQRKTLMVFGALGLIGYFCHLGWDLFKDAMLFPIAMSLLGLAIIMLAIKYQRNHEKIQQSIQSWIPDSLKPWIPSRALNQSIIG